MTVSTTTNRINYTGDGVTAVFAFPYKFIATADLVIYVAGVLLTTGYTVGTPTDSGANVTFTAAPASSAPIIILANPAQLQSTSLPSTGPFPAKAVETALDKLTLLIQRVSELCARSFRLADNDSSGASTILPTPTSNALIGWNQGATALQNVNPTTLATIVAFGTANADVFTGTGAQTAFTLSANPGAQANLDVAVGGVTQTPGTDYVWSGGAGIAFTTAPPNLAKILVRYYQGLPQGVTDSAASLFTPDETGSVATNVRAKLLERKSIYDFMTAAQIADTRLATPVLDLSSVLLAARNWLATSQNPTNTANLSLVFPSGIYRYSVSPNWAIDNVEIVNDGAVYFRYFGTGNACIIDADGYGRVNMVFGRFIIQAPSTALDGVYIRQIQHSDFHLTVRGAGVGSSGISMLGCVCTTLHRPTVSNVEYGWYASAQPKYGLTIGSNVMIGKSAANTIINPIFETLSDTGINISAGDANTFIGGTSEGNANYGVQIAYGSNANKFIGTDFETNATADVLLNGFGNELSGCDSSTKIIFPAASEGNIVHGGYMDKIVFQAGSARNIVDACFVNRSLAATWLTNAGNNYVGKCIDRYSGGIGIPYAKLMATTGIATLSLPNNTLQTMVIYMDNTIHNACNIVAPDTTFTRTGVGQWHIYPGHTANITFISAGGGNLTYAYI